MDEGEGGERRTPLFTKRQEEVLRRVLVEGESFDEAAESLVVTPERVASLYEGALEEAMPAVSPDGSAPLSRWTRAAIDGQCMAAWRVYERELKERYVRYFENHPDLARPPSPAPDVTDKAAREALQRARRELRGDAYSAKDMPAALPPGRGHLADRIDRAELHRHHLSAKSSRFSP